LHVYYNIPHSPNPPSLITLPLPSTALPLAIRRVIVLPTIISLFPLPTTRPDAFSTCERPIAFRRDARPARSVGFIALSVIFHPSSLLSYTIFR
ncbi:uncharacterized protein SCHCODRAFT_02718758, partial [Schizophyllum commune H4-8]|uniref:uncharacterized protein n=1 Tax=Schizophyllum commune (strain H4-8 / FGSC 9210) TaxID=578458 RepID=UPI00215E0DF9